MWFDNATRIRKISIENCETEAKALAVLLSNDIMSKLSKTTKLVLKLEATNTHFNSFDIERSNVDGCDCRIFCYFVRTIMPGFDQSSKIEICCNYFDFTIITKIFSCENSPFLCWCPIVRRSIVLAMLAIALNWTDSSCLESGPRPSLCRPKT